MHKISYCAVCSRSDQQGYFLRLYNAIPEPQKTVQYTTFYTGRIALPLTSKLTLTLTLPTNAQIEQSIAMSGGSESAMQLL